MVLQQQEEIEELRYTHCSLKTEWVYMSTLLGLHQSLLLCIVNGTLVAVFHFQLLRSHDGVVEDWGWIVALGIFFFL